MATSKLVRKPAPPLKPDPILKPNPEPPVAVREDPFPARVENRPSKNYPDSQPKVQKPIPLTPAQQEYKRVYPNTVYPLEFAPVEPVKVSAPVESGKLAGLKAKVDAALAGADLTGAQRRKVDEAFATAAKEK